MPPFGKKSSISIDHPSLEYLSHRGPHRVAAGNLADAGMPGLVFAPTSGRGLPAVALSHGWLQPARRYSDTMRFLASWGFVVVAPDTERGPIPSHGAMAMDLTAALDLVATGKLGNGRVRVDPQKLGVIGHSIGGGAAVLAAAARSGIGAVVTVTAAATHPSAVEAAARVRVPGLHLIGADDDMAEGDGSSIAAAWAGEAQLRTVKGASHLGLAEGSHWSSTLTGSGNEKRIQHLVRLLATAFLLRHLTDGEQLADELKGKVRGTTLEDLDEVRAE
ncbi:dienelactone hydrolase family protein [Nakamurella sp. PAMC28650]|uniref:dienelactone hydrolase family protein n=1 Tax=Nakamurella sp. PAMC28650 TaxID=2762325 RepID=UPI00164ECFC3|nr:dienelactone hydrolase family protein [Nakamurella sp. PAMC28650]QNK83017.1 dienelactone hydrolase family protein [Nakamurella sp. PAMC28650]